MALGRQFIHLLDRQEWLDQSAEWLQTAVQSFYQSLGTIGQKIADLLHGTWLGHPVHSVTTDVPTGAYTAAFTMDLLEMTTGEEAFGKGADAAITLGVAGAISSAVTGITDWQHTTGHARRVGMAHAILNTGALVCYLLSLSARKNRNREAGWGLAMVGYGATLAAAYLGGHLVYSQKIGVDHAPRAKHFPDGFTPTMRYDDLPENQLFRVEVDNKPVLLVRRSGRVFAIAETCSHLGGPLAEGELEDDNTVICPWHRSRFSLEDGRLIHGPSVYDQPCFDTRVQDGMIEVRVTQHT